MIKKMKSSDNMSAMDNQKGHTYQGQFHIGSPDQNKSNTKQPESQIPSMSSSFLQKMLSPNVHPESSPDIMPASKQTHTPNPLNIKLLSQIGALPKHMETPKKDSMPTAFSSNKQTATKYENNILDQASKLNSIIEQEMVKPTDTSLNLKMEDDEND